MTANAKSVTCRQSYQKSFSAVINTKTVFFDISPAKTVFLLTSVGSEECFDVRFIKRVFSDDKIATVVFFDVSPSTKVFLDVSLAKRVSFDVTPDQRVFFTDILAKEFYLPLVRRDECYLALIPPKNVFRY